MRLLALLVAICVAWPPSVDADKSFGDKSVVKILYGSCHSTKLVSPLWPLIVERKPDVWIFGGDNMYADKMRKDLLYSLMHAQLPFDKANEQDLIDQYKALHADPGYKKLVDTGVEQIAIWDDHDYGISQSKVMPLLVDDDH
jgi:alkaline phosphatase D